MNTILIISIGAILTAITFYSPVRAFLLKNHFAATFVYSLAGTFLGVYLSLHLSQLESRERERKHAVEILEKVESASLSLLRSAGRSAVFPRTASAAFYASLDPNKIRGYLDLDAAKLFFTSKYIITLNNVIGALSENIADSKAQGFDQHNRDELYTSVKFRTQELVFLTELEIAYQQGKLTADDYALLHDCNAEAYELPIRANQYEGPDCAEKVRSAVEKLPSRVTAAMRQFAVAD